MRAPGTPFPWPARVSGARNHPSTKAIRCQTWTGILARQSLHAPPRKGRSMLIRPLALPAVAGGSVPPEREFAAALQPGGKVPDGFRADALGADPEDLLRHTLRVPNLCGEPPFEEVFSDTREHERLLLLQFPEPADQIVVVDVVIRAVRLDCGDDLVDVPGR